VTFSHADRRQDPWWLRVDSNGLEELLAPKGPDRAGEDERAAGEGAGM